MWFVVVSQIKHVWTVSCAAGEEQVPNTLANQSLCQACGDDHFKAVRGAGNCLRCEGNFTSTHDNRTACHYCEFVCMTP